MCFIGTCTLVGLVVPDVVRLQPPKLMILRRGIGDRCLVDTPVGPVACWRSVDRKIIPQPDARVRPDCPYPAFRQHCLWESFMQTFSSDVRCPPNYPSVGVEASPKRAFHATSAEWVATRERGSGLCRTGKRSLANATVSVRPIDSLDALKKRNIHANENQIAFWISVWSSKYMIFIVQWDRLNSPQQTQFLAIVAAVIFNSKD